MVSRLTGSSRLAMLSILVLMVTPALAQRGGGGFGGGGGQRPGGSQEVQIKPYADVITDKAVTAEGVFKTHRIGTKLYFEIPKDELNKDFLWVTEIASTPEGGYNGTAADNLVVQWQRVDDKVLLRQMNFNNRAENSEALELGIENSNVPPIIMSFNIEALADDGAAVIDVTNLYTSNPPEFDVARRLRVGALDSSRSYLDEVKTFQTNIEVRSVMTFREGAPPPTTTGPGRRFPGGFGATRSGPSNTAVVNYSMVKLPEKPMMGRLYDDRVGYFSNSFTVYGSANQASKEKRYIARFRLEKKDPNAAVSEPVQPIVFYLSREVPEKWRPYLKQAVEDWQPAFEQAGFKNAIICKDAPDDPNWDPEDARYSVIRWAPSTTENAMGPHVSDPRSGEVISAHIIVWNDVLALAQRWYFVQASASDKSAQKIPFSDELLGRLMRYVVSHEVGHTLGFEHNFKASSEFTIAQLRDPDWTKKWGTEASIMDYGRFNYVAQPDDHAGLIPKIAQYDIFAVKWGYTPIPGAKNPKDEVPTLDKWAAQQVDQPLYRFGANSNEDPSQQSEDLGNDAVEATRLGLMNIDRIMDYVYSATVKMGEDYSDLEQYYNGLWGQRNVELGHVARNIGGVVMTNYHGGRGGAVYNMLPRERQKAAMDLLVSKCFETPHSMIRDDILNKLGPTNVASQVNGSQTRVLATLLSDTRIQQMLDLEATNGTRAYTVREMFTDLRNGIFHELDDTDPQIDNYRMALQVAYVNMLAGKLVGEGEVRGLARLELGAIRGMIAARMDTASDWKVRGHLADLKATIDKALE